MGLSESLQYSLVEFFFRVVICGIYFQDNDGEIVF